jgi:hypothetical protein
MSLDSQFYFHLLNLNLAKPCCDMLYDTKQPQTYIPPSSTTTQPEKIILWDRKTEGGFPETKVLKQRVRDRIDPKKDLGHSDVGGKKKEAVKQDGEGEGKEGASEETGEEKENGGRKGEKPEEGSVADSSVDGGAELKRNPDGTICEDCR